MNTPIISAMSLLVLLASLGMSSQSSVAQEQIQRLPPTEIVITEESLSAFVDETCHHFEMALDRFKTGQNEQVGDHLRIAAAFLRLESNRATPDGKIALDASIKDLMQLAETAQKGRVNSVSLLRQSFARAHFALASHHCIKSAHRCCQPATFLDKKEMARAGYDLHAATKHAERGSFWAGEGLSEETMKALQDSKFAANKLISQSIENETDIQHSIHTLHHKLEVLTGRKIQLARPAINHEPRGVPSIFR